MTKNQNGSICRVEDVAYVRFRAPDLGCMSDFLRDFGLIEAARDDHRLIMRGHGTAPVVHVTEPGPAAFAGFAFRVTDREDLKALAEHDHVPVADLDMPGGGAVVRLTDPDGFLVEVIHGQQPVDQLAVPPPLPWNEGGRNDRLSAFRRPPRGPSHVLRLGHVVLSVRDFWLSERWYKERFGLITSDEIQPPNGIGIGAFMRADRGNSRTSDHHTLFLFQHPAGPAFLHAAFEVVDLDDLMTGHEHLLAQGRDAAWGVGRHKLGSQIFDYCATLGGTSWSTGPMVTNSTPGTAGVSPRLPTSWVCNGVCLFRARQEKPHDRLHCRCIRLRSSCHRLGTHRRCARWPRRAARFVCDCPGSRDRALSLAAGGRVR